jgi:hypothetical protein
VTGADGTTFIIAYQYANEGDLDELNEAATREIANKIISSSTNQKETIALLDRTHHREN